MTRKKYECEVCGRSFDSFQALGGHTLEHRQPEKQDDQQGNPVVETVAENHDVDEASQINKYLDKGRTYDQLTKQLGFRPTTVRQEIDKRIARGGSSKDSGKSDAEVHLTLPETVGTGKEQRILPEYILTQLEGLDGNRYISPLQAILLLQAARRMEREDIFEEVKMLQGLAEAQSKVTTSQLSVFKEAKSESLEVAREAAADVARQLIPEIQALKGQIAAGAAPDPFTRMMNVMQNIPRMMQAGQQLMGMMGMPVPGTGPQPGQAQLQPQSRSDEQPPGLAGPQLATPQQPPQAGPQLGGVGKATEDEVREAFGD
jgi:hypothetical protein